MLRKESEELNHFSYAYTNILLFSRYPIFVLLQPDHGGVTNENAREVSVKLDFLLPGISYEATFYADGPDADFISDPARSLFPEDHLSHFTDVDAPGAPGVSARRLPVVIIKADFVQLLIVGLHAAVKKIFRTTADVVEFAAVLLHVQHFLALRRVADVAAGRREEAHIVEGIGIVLGDREGVAAAH